MRAFKMPGKVRIWAPKGKVPADLKKALAEAAGGLTETAAKGSWVNAQDKLIVEPIEVLEVFHTSAMTEAVSRVVTEIVQSLQGQGEQAILVELDGDGYIYK